MGDFSNKLGNFVSGTVGFTKKVAKGVKKVNDSIKARNEEKDKQKSERLTKEFQEHIVEFNAAVYEMNKDDSFDINFLKGIANSIIDVGEEIITSWGDDPYVLFYLAKMYRLQATPENKYMLNSFEYIERCIESEDTPDSATYFLKYEICKSLKKFSEAQKALQIAQEIKKIATMMLILKRMLKLRN